MEVSQRMTSRKDFIKTSGLASLSAFSGISAFQKKSPSWPSLKSSVVFFGDSITDGMHTSDNNASTNLGNGFPSLVAGWVGYHFPESQTKFINRGVAASRITDMQLRWNEEALKLSPSIISVLGGINDVSATVENKYPETYEKFENALHTMLGEAVSHISKPKVIICEPFLLDGFLVHDQLDAWKNELQKRREIMKKVISRFDVLFLPLQEKFDKALLKAPASHWSWDGIHPTPAGHQLISEEWIQFVSNHIK